VAAATERGALPSHGDDAHHNAPVFRAIVDGMVLDGDEHQEDVTMRYLPGWAFGALGTAAVVAVFFAGGVFGAPNPASRSAAEFIATAPVDATVAHGLEVSCEPGQRAVVRQASSAGASAVACMSGPAGTAAATAFGPAAYPGSVMTVAETSTRPYATPTVMTEPVEVYRPRSVPVHYGTREVARPTRTVKKSVAIIAGSTTAGAVVGGLANGRKGALIGGIVGGGAATLWDQMTRRRNGGER
jgi:hypothetical protein